MTRGRPRIGTSEEAAERRRRQTADRVRRLRERRRAEKRSSLTNGMVETEAASPTIRTHAAHGMVGERLCCLVERIERLEKELSGLRTRNPALADAYAAERRSIQEDLRNAWGEAKTTGFDAEALREIIRLRSIPSAQRMELERTVSIYKQAIGMS
jgi:uncharacterized protein (UPF0335 family)